MHSWKPKEIIVHVQVKDDPVTNFIAAQCPEVPVQYVESGTAASVIQASAVLEKSGKTMLDKILAGKSVLFVAPASNDLVDEFSMPDERILCPHFDRLKLASNGCFYQCDWCYLKLTYRAAYPFITVRAQYDKIEGLIEKRLKGAKVPVIFNSGELADSLALEHLTGAARHFIPWFGKLKAGYLFMLTKSTNVEGILEIPHNGHTFVSWSMNNEQVSRKYEIGAPTFERRLAAAEKVQKAGYPVRIRLDPIVPFEGWQNAYAETIRKIFSSVTPERITLGTLRFEEGFYNMRNTIFNSGPELPSYVEQMNPMFSPKHIGGRKKPLLGKYSFSTQKRTEIFDFAIREIRKFSNCKVALCKESAEVWKNVGLDPLVCDCVCQL